MDVLFNQQRRILIVRGIEITDEVELTLCPEGHAVLHVNPCEDDGGDDESSEPRFDLDGCFERN